jgi:hypothetical protein
MTRWKGDSTAFSSGQAFDVSAPANPVSRMTEAGERQTGWIEGTTLNVRTSKDSGAVHSLTIPTGSTGLSVLPATADAAMWVWSETTLGPRAAWFDGAVIQASTSLGTSASLWTVAGNAAGNIVALNQTSGILKSVIWNGTSWTDESIVTGANPGVTGKPAVAMSPTGSKAWAAYVKDSGSLPHVWAQAFNGTIWDASAVMLTTTSTSLVIDKGPLIATDAAGNALVVWDEIVNGTTYNLKSKFFKASGTTGAGEWQTLSTIATSSTDPGITRVGISSSGSGHFNVWWQTQTGSSPASIQIRAAAFLASSAVWETTAVLDDFSDSAASVSEPSAAMDATGNGMVWWTKSTGSSSVVRMAYYNIGVADVSARWVATQNVDDPADAASPSGVVGLFDKTGDGLFLWTESGVLKWRASE